MQIPDEDIEQSQYAALFPRPNPPHMVLSSWDGSKRINLLGLTQQKVTWPKITSVLKQDYRRNPNSAIKTLEKLLNKFDALDKRESELSAQLARAKDKAKADQAKKLEKQIAELQEERTELLEDERTARDLKLVEHAETSDD